MMGKFFIGSYLWGGKREIKEKGVLNFGGVNKGGEKSRQIKQKIINFWPKPKGGGHDHRRKGSD